MHLRIATTFLALALFAVSSSFAQDGQNLGVGQTLKFTQDTFTQFGDATGGGQDSAGGSEIDQVWGDFDPNTGILSFSVSGNLEGNFNKFWLFLDAVAGGENVLDATNVDGGFNEIQNMAGMTFDTGFTADHGLRFEVGSGFYGLRAFDLVNETAFDVATGGGPGDLPLSGAGGPGGILFGWDNSNILGVDGTSAANAATATTGWEIDIDLATLLGTTAVQDIRLAGFISSGDGAFLSNQVIGGLGGLGNLGDPTLVDFNAINGDQFVTFANPVPEPSSLVFLLLGGIGACSRRRRS
jgi:hypothetical protein